MALRESWDGRTGRSPIAKVPDAGAVVPASLYFTVRDGLRLHARQYPARRPTGRRPVLCLAGLTRNSKDFHDIALALADAGPLSRDVYALDSRGRGRSEHDPVWQNYSPFIEALDALDFLALRRLREVAVIGTCRGGILAMIMATLRPTSLGCVVLNDIGPVIEPTGLVRLIGYVGRVPVPDNWLEARRLVQRLGARDFPRLDEATWDEIARQTFADVDGAPEQDYDVAIGRSLSVTDIATGLPTMWDQLGALSRMPTMVLRGECSDFLSAQTVREMT
ncbi:MAG: alpha/beta hydrolase, partial [Parvularculaceae bacterium]|nr:alpha/beta hydrolase [Parvularculaceae bacterium]